MANHLKFDVRRDFDERLLQVEASDLHRFLTGPTVFDLRRNGVQPFFVSTLLHGNETSGWDAVRRFITDTSDASIVLFIGNVRAAAQAMRHLPDEVDFNRIWRQQPWRDDLNDLLERYQPWCGIDIHNNSGPNPHYSVITDQHESTLALASIFSNRVIFTHHTLDILAHAISPHCPSLTVETGTVDDLQSAQRAYDLLTRLNEIRRVPMSPKHELEAYETIGIVKVEHENGSLENFPQFDERLKESSFSTLAAGSPFVNCLPSGWRVSVLDPAHSLDLTDEFFEFRERRAYLKREIVMSMFTHTPILALQDCVCYFLTSTSLVRG